MKARIACGALLMILVPCTEWGGRVMAEYQTGSDAASMLAESASVLNQFEETTNRVNFSQWNAPYGVTSAMRTYLDGTRAEVRSAKRLIAQAQSGSTVSTVQMFEVFVTLVHAGAASAHLGQAEAEFGNDPELGSDLFSLGGSAGKLEDKFHATLSKRLTAEELELSGCRAQAR